eukprot:5614632-Pleurochrysis_carterae.AAC.2
MCVSKCVHACPRACACTGEFLVCIWLRVHTLARVHETRVCVRACEGPCPSFPGAVVAREAFGGAAPSRAASR